MIENVSNFQKMCETKFGTHKNSIFHHNTFSAGGGRFFMTFLGFKLGKSLKDFLVRAKIKSPSGEGESNECKGKRCEVCKCLNNTNSFENREGTDQYGIKGGNLNCNSSNVVYLVQCKTCKIQYVTSASTKFRLRFNKKTT